MKLRKPHRLGVVLLAGLCLGLSGGVMARLYSLQHVRHDHYSTRAERQHFRSVVLQPERGDILDRTGRPMAQSTGRITLYVNPKHFRADHVIHPDVEAPEALNLEEISKVLASELGTDAESIHKRITGPRTFPIARRIRPEMAERLHGLLESFNVDSRGFWLERESVRVYPSHVASPVIGFCSKDEYGDNKGLAGLELQYDEILKGQKVETRTTRSAISESLEPWRQEDLLTARGKTLVLTIDTNIQQAVESVLAETVEKFKAASAGAIVMDTQTGAIIAMGGFPTFNNNQFSQAPPAHLRNRLLTDPLETGSVAKLFTAAVLIDRDYIGPDSLIDCSGGFAVIDGRRLTDSPGHAPLHVVTFRESLRWSSNVGIVRAAQALQNPEWYQYLRDLGFGAPTGIDLPGEGSGILHPLQRWTKFSRTSLPMGYEIAMTPIQIVAAISATANGGTYYRPYLVAEIRDAKGNSIEVTQPQVLRQVFRPTTSAILRDLMEDVVDSGTGKKAMIPGYRIGGKTGTTRKSDIFDRREYIASFAGVLPIHSPRLSIYLYVDAPKTAYYASQVAAPAFQAIARAATLHMGIAPSETIPVADLKKGGKLDIPWTEEVVTDHAPGMGIGLMPRYHGMTIKQVRMDLPDKLKKVKFLGSGVVSDQSPPPGEPINDLTEIVLHFSPTLEGAKQ